MGLISSLFLLNISVLLFSIVFFFVRGDPLVPALCIFGDSVFDVGNNNNLSTLIKANFPPYGRDFITHQPTGRFCNGKLATDFTAEYLGFNSYPPAYLSQDANISNNILQGVNFASASSGYYDYTAKLYSAVTLTQQLAYYKEWQKKMVNLVGNDKANALFSGGIHLISAGSSDFIQNYYIDPFLFEYYSPDEFSDILIKSYSTFIQNLYSLGVRRIGVTNLPPIGCLPAAITLFGYKSNDCVERMNRDAVYFNDKLNVTSMFLKIQNPELKLVVFDIYNILLDMIMKPTDSGFFESRKACCGTGVFETSFLCTKRSIGTCSNATEYVFWDGFHPSESANEKLALSLSQQGYDLIS